MISSNSNGQLGSGAIPGLSGPIELVHFSRSKILIKVDRHVGPRIRTKYVSPRVL